MEFSQSFEFGNSTFMKLESQAKHAIKDDQGIEKPLDIIQESPTGSKSSNRSSALSTTRLKSRLPNTTQHPQRSMDSTQHRKFRRSKSDSTLPKVPILSNEDLCDNYSEFFKSDFSMPNDNPIKESSEKHTSYIRVSQIEGAFNDVEKDVDSHRNQDVQGDFFESDFSLENSKEFNAEENAGHICLDIEDPKVDVDDPEFADGEDDNDSSLDKPIFSEDLKDLIETEDLKESDNNLWNDTLPLSNIPKGNDGKDYEDPQVVLHEISSFLCPPQENVKERSHLINKELEISHKVFKEFDQQLHSSIEQVSLSCMSPDQLQVTQDTPNSPKNNGVVVKSSQRKPIIKTQARVISDSKENTDVMDRKENTKMLLSDNMEALKSISAWNLPLSILKEYERKGVKKMFDWQIQCLSNPKVLFEHCNLVYSAPTSAGKTLVSEILLLKTVLERGKKVLLILPFISVVREKMFYLQDLLTAAGYRVEGFFGGYTPPGGFESINVAICTIEKANSIVNKLLEQGKLDEIGTVVVDEVHLISDPGRGYILELLLAKVLYMSRKYALQIQVIAMSATLANVELLKKWLDAELYITDFRPVALQEMIKVGNKIYDNNLKVLRSVTQPSVDIKEPFPSIPNDTDHVAQLCIETLIDGCSAIVFCPSKDWCENLSVQLAGAIHAVGKQGGEWGTRLRAQLKRNAIDDVKRQLQDIPTGLDTILEKTVTYGCAFHHAGLTTEERDIVEASFKSGALKIIVATSTLSSGVNLPARRVLIRSPLFGGKQMSSLTYRQMIGRAGRTGKDILGESILICTDSNARVGKELISADLKPISSCLELDSSTHLKRALLEVISSGVASTKDDIDNFVNCTLLSVQKRLSNQEKDNQENELDDEYTGSALDFLVEYEFVRLQTNEETQEQYYVATRLGMACLASSMPPTDGLILFAELQKSRRCFVLESELHAVYLVTPYSVCYQLQELDWLFFLDMWEKLTPAMRKVGELVGVKESFLVRAMRGQTKLDYKLMQIHKRFYTALALQELVNETPINVVASKFKCSRGMLQSLQQMASTFAGIVTSFCSSLQWDTLTLIVSQFKERLYFGIHRDLIDLMRIPDINHKRARALFDAGVTSLVDLANADILSVEKILYDGLSFDSAKQHDNENATEAAQRNEARNFYITGKAGITVSEAAKLLVQEARQFVQYEIGVGNINWSQREANIDHNNISGKEESEIHMSYEENKYQNNKESNAEKNDLPKCSDIKKALAKELMGTNKSTSKADLGKVKTNDNADRMSSENKDVLRRQSKDKTIQHQLITKDHVSKFSKQVEANSSLNSISKPKDIYQKNDISKEQVQKNSLSKHTPANREKLISEFKSNPPEKLEVFNCVSNTKQIEDKQTQNHKLANMKNNGDILKSKCLEKTKEKENLPPFKSNHAIDTKNSKIANVMKEPGIQNEASNILTTPSEMLTSKRTSTEKRKSSETVSDHSEATPPKLGKTKDNLKEQLIESEEKPSTSKKAQRLLRAKQLSEMKKQEWAKRKEEQNQKENPQLVDNNLNCETVKKSINNEINNKETPIYNTKEKSKAKTSSSTNERIAKNCYVHLQTNTPRSSHVETISDLNNESGSTYLPRRSPRNLISSTRIENAKSSPVSTTPRSVKPPLATKQTVSSPNELFADDNEEPFLFNSEINEILTKADNFKVPLAKDDANNLPEDEIPSSQQLVEDVPANKTSSPHASRFLRSLRATQRIQTPRAIKKPEVINTDKQLSLQESNAKYQGGAPLQPPPQEPPSSTSIELSDLSMENSLIKNPIQLNASHILSCSKTDTDSSSFKSIDIIDICGDQQLFKGAFKEFMANKRLGVCLGIQQLSGKRKPIIGANLLLNQVAAAERDKESTQNYEFQIDDTNYLSGIGFCISDNLVYYMNMQSECSCRGLTGEIKGKYLCMLLRSSDHTLIMYDAKEQLKVLRKLLTDLGDIAASLEDPKVANWLLQPDKMHNLHSLAKQFAPECSSLINLCGSGRGYNSYGLDSESAILAKVRCSIECCVTVHILKGQIENLERIGTGQLQKFFKELEMPLQISLCNMELIGFPTNSDALHNLFQQMVETMKRLETKIYELHGSRFNLGSSSAVARVLGLHRKTNGRISTSKQILEKIDTPISQMIIIYRKLSVTLTKNIQPLLKCVKLERIHGQSITFTSTGRISMTEPNLQNVAKDFDIEIAADKFTISCRSAFYPSDSKRCLISSDFCQLEMRILAHLSQDSALLNVMRSEKDVFVAIAARWNKISENSVTEQVRNGTKQICYGIVYGMGMRALSEGLKCTEQEAKLVSEQFHAAYPGIRAYVEKIIKFAKNNGYIETITGRRRYLEHINSEESLMKSQAERQAVNSTIQGSAADIAKSAILRMEKNIIKYRDKLGINPQNVRLVLHLHDELIFEVPEDKAKKIAKVLSVTMENCVKLNVPLKVKLKIGKSWGDLKEVKL